MTEPKPLKPERWLEEYGDILFRYSLARLKNQDEAEDVVQETFVAAWQSRDRYAGRATERNWLLGILKHKVIDQLRRHYREKPVSELAGRDESEESLNDFFDRLHHWKEKPAAWSDPRAALEEKDFWKVLNRCMEGLPRRWAAVFQLRILDQFSYQEACQIMNVTTTNLGALLHRARLRMRECLEKNWFVQSRKKKKR